MKNMSRYFERLQRELLKIRDMFIKNIRSSVSAKVLLLLRERKNSRKVLVISN